MEAILFFLFFVIAIGSLVTTVIAIIQILNNDFKESKLMWILISMIAIIGPVLWLTKGRRLIIKPNPEERLEIKNRFSKRTHYKELLQGNLLIKLLTLVAVGMILIGYLIRGLNIYYFWEVSAIGYVILLIALAAFLWHDRKARKAKKVKHIWSSVGVGLICFILFVKGLMMVVLPISDAYAAAKKQLTNDVELTSEIGEITGFSVLPSGSLQLSTDSRGTFGTASMELIIKGSKKYLERTVFLEKAPERDWEIIHVQK